MSTRCNIGFYEKSPTKTQILKPEALLYKHSDGYPDTENGVVGFILPFLQKFNEKRGLDDIEYASAQLMHFMIAESNAGMAKWWTEQYQSEKPYEPDFLGYGICKPEFLHWDIEYYYAISPTDLKVYEVNMDWGAKKMQSKHFKLIDTVKI